MKLIIYIIALCLLAGLACAATYSLPITFSGYTKTETLTNFPVLVKLTNSISGFAYSQFASANGYDLRFTNSTDTTELNYEIESWNTNGESCVWVQVPLLTNGAFITAYWGDATKTAQQAYTTNGVTWAGYDFVFHYPNGTTLDATDSSSNRHNGTIIGATASSGIVDGCAAFNGSSHYITNTWDYPSSKLTWSAWIKSPAEPVATSVTQPIAFGGTVMAAFGFSWNHSNPTYRQGVYFFDAESSWHGAPITTPLVANTWYNIAVTWDGTTSVIFCNGVSNNSVAVPSLMLNDPVSFAGSGLPTGNYFNGNVDEFRYRTSVLSSNWVWACYMNQGSNTAFNSYGAVSGGTTGMSVWEQFARQLD